MKKEIEIYVEDWKNKCYSNGIPDEAPSRLESLNKVPSYRQICLAILKNDFQLKTLGKSRKRNLLYEKIKYNQLLSENKIKQKKLWK